MRTASTLSPEFRNDVRLRLTRRGRALICSVVVILAVIAAFAAGMLIGAPDASAGSEGLASYATVTVAEGQNLWDIAEPHTPAGQDVRDYVLLVQEINDLSSSTVHPGQTLSLPLQ